MAERYKPEPGWLADILFDANVDARFQTRSMYRHIRLAELDERGVAELRRRYRERFKDWTGEEL